MCNFVMLSFRVLVVFLTLVSCIDSKEAQLLSRQNTVESRIVNGNKASKRQFPFHVGIKFKGPKLCGFLSGSILTEWYVLTCAHSFAGKP